MLTDHEPTIWKTILGPDPMVASAALAASFSMELKSLLSGSWPVNLPGRHENFGCWHLVGLYICWPRGKTCCDLRNPTQKSWFQEGLWWSMTSYSKKQHFFKPLPVQRQATMGFKKWCTNLGPPKMKRFKPFCGSCSWFSHIFSPNKPKLIQRAWWFCWHRWCNAPKPRRCRWCRWCRRCRRCRCRRCRGGAMQGAGGGKLAMWPPKGGAGGGHPALCIPKLWTLSPLCRNKKPLAIWSICDARIVTSVLGHPCPSHLAGLSACLVFVKQEVGQQETTKRPHP